MQEQYLTKLGLYRPKAIDERQLIFVGIFYLLCTSLIVLVLPEKQQVTGIFYIAIVTLSTAFGALSQYKVSENPNKIMLFLSFILMFFLIAFRDASGIDDEAYARIFSNVEGVSLFSYIQRSDIEIGFKLLTFFLHKVTNGNYFFFQVICSLIPIAIFYISFYKYENRISIPLAIILLYSLYGFQMLAVSLVRMFIAISIVFYAFNYIIERKIFEYIVAICFASAFHISAITMLMFLFFMIRKSTLIRFWRQFLVLGLCTLPIAFLFVGKVLAPILGARYASYANLNQFEFRLGAFDMLPFFMCGLYLKRLIPPTVKRAYIFALVLVALSCIFSLYSSMVSLGRLIFYANLGNMFVIPMAYRYAQKSSVLKFVLPCIVIAYSFLYLWITQFSLEAHIPFLFPYRNIFFEI